MNRTQIIQFLIDTHGYKTYLEIGMHMGHNFNSIRVPQKESVDPDKRWDATHRITSDEFFASLHDHTKWDIIFIDGLHTEEQTSKDLENALKHLNPNGRIVLHDSYPDSAYLQRPLEEFIEGTPWCGTSWKAVYRHGCKFPNSLSIIKDDYGVAVINPMAKRGNSKAQPKDVIYEDHFREMKNHLIGVYEFMEKERSIIKAKSNFDREPLSAAVQSQKSTELLYGAGYNGKRVAVVSANFGNKDNLRLHGLETSGVKNVDFYMFTDNPNRILNGWDYIKPPNTNILLPREISRYIKLNLHMVLPNAGQYSHFIWTDARIQVHDWSRLVEIAVAKAGSYLAMYEHPDRNCVYNELTEVLKYKAELLDDLAQEEAIKEWVEYLEPIVPKRAGLWASGVMCIANNDLTNTFMERWSNLVQTRSIRDQLVLPYLFTKYPRPTTMYPESGTYHKNNLFTIPSHA